MPALFFTRKTVVLVACLLLASLLSGVSPAPAASASQSSARVTTSPNPLVMGLQATVTFGAKNRSQVSVSQFNGSYTNSQESLDALLARDTSNDFSLNAAGAMVGVSAALTRAIWQAVKNHEPFDVLGFLREGSMNAVAGFVLAAPFSQGPVNLTIARDATDALLRWLSLRLFSGKDRKVHAGDIRSNLATALAVGLARSVAPAELETWLPCQSRGLGPDVCNGLYELAWSGFVQQGAQEALSAMLDSALWGNDRSAGSAGMKAYALAGLRGGIFGVLERAITMTVFGPEQFLDPATRARTVELLREAGLSAESQDCLMRTMFREGGIYSWATDDTDMSFNMGQTTMGDDSVYETDEFHDGIRAHEVGGHCTQYLDEGYYTFIIKYGIETLRYGNSVHTDADTGACLHNSYECEARALQEWVYGHWSIGGY